MSVLTNTPRHRRRTRRLAVSLVVALSILATTAANAQDSREAEIARAKAEKAKALHPYVPSKAETYIDRAENLLLAGGLHWHPFFDSAYAGGGFTLGAGYRRFVSSYNTVDLRGSITFSGYKRIEAEFLAPRLFNRRGVLSVIGGWREATQVGFYGIGTGRRHRADDRANYSFTQPYVSGHARGLADPQAVRSSAAGSRSRSGIRGREADRPRPSRRSTRRRRCPAWARRRPTCTCRARPAARLAHVGRATRVAAAFMASPSTISPITTAHFSFRRVDYDAIQHIPCCATPGCCRCTAASRRPTSATSEQMPFFMLPALGGGSTLRGFPSWRFRDSHSLLMQAEWRVLANRFLDMALFYDAGKVTARPRGHQLRRPQERLRSRLPAARTGRDAAAHRIREEQRGPRARVLVEGRVLGAMRIMPQHS